jgi:DNA polymerase-4
LAKTAAGLHKPDGLDVIDCHNFLQIYGDLDLQDLCGIGRQNAARLNKHQIFNVLDFYKTSALGLKVAFHSIVGFYWYQRLRGYEVDDAESKRQSFNNSYVLPPKVFADDKVFPVLAKLVEKMSFRMRTAGFKARGLHLSVIFRHDLHRYWHKGLTFPTALFSAVDIYEEMKKIYCQCPFIRKQEVKTLSVTCFDLVEMVPASNIVQKNLFDFVDKKFDLISTMDSINHKWGGFVVSSALLLSAKDSVRDAIAFSGQAEVRNTFHK